MKQIHHSTSETQTFAIAEKFSQSLQQGDVVALYGELGSGKTHFVKGLCKGIGITHNITSPTFTIVNEYTEGKIPIYHFDCYRLKTLSELDEIGFDEYLEKKGICLIEWADLIKEKLPHQRYDIYITVGSEQHQRTITIEKITQ